MFSAILSKVVRSVQFTTESYVRDRDWWRDADPSWVVLVIAGRAFAYSLIVLVAAAGVSLYGIHQGNGIADALALLTSACSACLFAFSACRIGDALALFLVRDADPNVRVAPWIRMLILAVALLGLAVILRCGYCIAVAEVLGTRWTDQPVQYLIALIPPLIAGIYLFASAARAFAMLRQPSFYPALVERVYGPSWRGFKNFRRL